jgi:DNA repair exonuclease SbcCD nuclease subunit
MGNTGAIMKYIKIELDKLNKFIDEKVEIGREFERINNRNINRQERMRYTAERWNKFTNTPANSLEEAVKKVAELSNDERRYENEMTEDMVAFAKNTVHLIDLIQGFLPD